MTTTREIDERSRVTIPAEWAKALGLQNGSEVLLVYRPVLQEIAVRKLQVKEVF